MRQFLQIAYFELTRLFFTRRGWLAILACALVWGLLLYYAVYRAARLLAADQQTGLLSLLLSEIGWQDLARWSVPELAIYWFFGLSLLPFFCIVLTADQTASDRARGTLRYLHLRATRWQIYFGRFFGQMLVQLLFILVTLLSTLGVVMWRDPSLLQSWLELSPAIVVNLLIVVLPYTALMAMVSILAKSARQATTFAVILWIIAMLLIGYLGRQFPELSMLSQVLPGSQISQLMRVIGWDALALAWLPLLQTLVLLAVGAVVVRRIDL